MSEKVIRNWVLRALSPIHAVPVENPVYPGHPDVDTVLGAIELKHLEEAPKKADTLVRVPHYTPQQRLWARQRRRAGGNCWMLIQVGATICLLDGAVAAEIIGKTTLEQIIGSSIKVWTGRPKENQLLSTLINNYRPWSFSFLRRVNDCSFNDVVKTGV